MNDKCMIKNNTIKPELIAPAGNLEKMKTAFAFGADAVYAGIPDFSLRVRINNFDLQGLAEGVEYAHSLKKKVYVTVNIFAHNKHLPKLETYLKALKKIGPDGLIASDPGVIAAIKKVWPEARIHLSTQANCTNWQAAKFWYDQGLRRVVLGRETTIDEVKEIHQKVPKLQLETFVHGAMCMAYSGRCFLSKYFNNRSANQGDCIQPCRWKQNVSTQKIKNNEQQESDSVFITPEGQEGELLELVQEEHGSYILNSQDMCLVKRLPEMREAGIASYKIEGRAKSVYYLANVVGAYRKAIDMIWENTLPAKVQKTELNKLYKELLDKLVNRGYTEGFMFEQGKTAQNLTDSHNVSEWEFCGQITTVNPQQLAINKKQKINTKKELVLVKVHNSIRVGDVIEIVSPGYDIIRMKVDKLFDVESGELVQSAHGGQGKETLMECKKQLLAYSVIRRKVVK